MSHGLCTSMSLLILCQTLAFRFSISNRKSIQLSFFQSISWFPFFPRQNSFYFFNFMGLTNTTAIMLSALTICQAFLSAVVSVTFFLYYSNCALVIFFLLEYRLLEDRIQVWFVILFSQISYTYHIQQPNKRQRNRHKSVIPFYLLRREFTTIS